MTAKSKMKAVCGVLCFLHIGISLTHGFSLPMMTATPTQIEVGFDAAGQIILNCSYCGSINIQTLFIQRQDITVRNYASVSRPGLTAQLDTAEVPAGSTVSSADISGNPSEIVLTIANPTIEFEGRYVCQADPVNGVDLRFLRPFSIDLEAKPLDVPDLVSRFVTLNDTVNNITDLILNLQPAPEQLNFTADIEELFDLHDNLTLRLNDTNTRVEDLEDAIADTVCLANFTVQEVERIDNTLFVDSDTYSGNSHYYVLSQFSPVSFNQAKLACFNKGGFLAEIDDQAEFDFVVEFLLEYLSPNQFALIGLFRDTDGNFTFTSGSPATFTDFFANGLDGEAIGDDCVALALNLFGQPGIKMDDVNCNFLLPGIIDYPIPGYLCEVDQSPATCPP